MARLQPATVAEHAKVIVDTAGTIACIDREVAGKIYKNF
ncbi:hypothetical protein SAMN05216419_100663 [Nitrosomonas cryotolerans]|nr:hypothetical protein SAMN05216419_100663 [Nitrosomonas cryotolerans]